MSLQRSNNSSLQQEMNNFYVVQKRRSHAYECISQGQIVRPTNGPEELTEEASLHVSSLQKRE